MAAITVGPNETFSHIHNVDTFTELKEGEATFILNGEEIQLEKNVKVAVPANTEHTLVNGSNQPATVICYYPPPRS